MPSHIQDISIVSTIQYPMRKKINGHQNKTSVVCGDQNIRRGRHGNGVNFPVSVERQSTKREKCVPAIKNTNFVKLILVIVSI